MLLANTGTVFIYTNLIFRNKYSELDLANQSEDLDDITVLKNEVLNVTVALLLSDGPTGYEEHLQNYHFVNCYSAHEVKLWTYF